MKYLSKLKKKDLDGKTVLVRAGFDLLNEDIELLRGTPPLRIQAILPTLDFLLKNRAKVILLSHRGRPKPLDQKISADVQNENEEQFSLRPFVKILENLTNQKINFINFRLPVGDFFEHAHVAAEDAPAGSIILLENLRFFGGETKNDFRFAKQLANLGKIYVNDAFSMDHRANASVFAIAKFLPAYAGFSLQEEIAHLSRIKSDGHKPLIIILGGAKISDKMSLIKKMLTRAQYLLMGGGVANTFNAALGIPVGNSLYEKEMLPTAKLLMKSGKIILPIDFAREDSKILDIGEKTTEEYKALIKKAKTIIWSGPLGLISDPRFRKGSEEIARAILKSQAFVVIGGGETVSVFQMVMARGHTGVKKSRVFLSTGGGAMLEFLSGKKMPGIEALR